jgi:hypothetical protein
MQVVSDFARFRLSELKIVDLASLEGHYSIELALRGSNVVGIEGRRSNIDKARAEQQRLNLKNVTFIQDDVRNLSRARYGEFDVVLCLGILYHLDSPEVFELLAAISEVCRDFAVVDTLISNTAVSYVDYKGSRYAGWFYTEYSTPPTTEEQEASAWAAIGNMKSFWLTRPSLYNALAQAGFSAVYECHNPPVTDLTSDRVTLIATKREKQALVATPVPEAIIRETWPEQPLPALSATLQHQQSTSRWTRKRALLGRPLCWFRR